MRNLNEKDWQQLILTDEEAIIIDARTPKEWADGVLENALLMNVLKPLKFAQDAQKLDKNKNYYVYCRSGQRSINACSLIEETGIEKTYNLLGGMIGWTGKGRPHAMIFDWLVDRIKEVSIVILPLFNSNNKKIYEEVKVVTVHHSTRFGF